MRQKSCQKDYQKIVIPRGLPAQRASAMAGKEVNIVIPRHVLARMRTPERIPTSEWADRYRVVTEIDAHPGPWRTSLVPHTRKIMDTIDLPHVREVCLCMVERAAKTQILINAMCKIVSSGMRSGNIFWLLPNENEAGKSVGERLIPVLRASRPTRGLLSRMADDTTRKLVRFRHGVNLFAAWANSPASMASYFGRLNICDETDKYPERTSEGTDPIKLIKKRARDERSGAKYLFASTPGSRYIYKMTMACEQVWAYRSRCPHCGESIDMDMEHLIIPDGADADTIGEYTLAYACNACGKPWDEKARKTAYLAGGWVAIKGADEPRPESVGFHLPALPLPMVQMEEIAKAVLTARTGGLSEKMALAHGYECRDYKNVTIDRDEDFILRLKGVDPLPRWTCPRDASVLLLMVDTQKRGFFYQTWAFVYGHECGASVIDHGFVEKFDNLRDLAAREYRDPSGRLLRPAAGWIDSGGGTDPHHPRHSRTVAVYSFCRRYPFFRPLKGVQRQDEHWRVKQRDFYPTKSGKRAPIPGGINLYTINVTFYKDMLAEKLMIEPHDPGALRLHAEVRGDFARQFCAEYRDERGLWHCQDGKANHHWDIAVYATAAADIMGIRHLRKAHDVGRPGHPRKTGMERQRGEDTEPTITNQQRERPAWLERRR